MKWQKNSSFLMHAKVIQKRNIHWVGVDCSFTVAVKEKLTRKKYWFSQHKLKKTQKK
jgi:hypothetical protein